LNLIIDIGNSRVKVALFTSVEPVQMAVFQTLSPATLYTFLQGRDIRHAMVAASGAWPLWLRSWLDEHAAGWWELTDMTSLPFQCLYQTPETLGRDRIAGLAGALALEVPTPFLIIDAGTCITMDLLDAENVYRGGSIAPGVRMRLQAMHDYTHRLPMVEIDADAPWPGVDTSTSLLAGSFWGALLEIEASIQRYEEIHGNINIVITGGDAALLAEKLKRVIFARRDLVLLGLNHLLNYNLHV
jgi:type III pantothenate kinase